MKATEENSLGREDNSVETLSQGFENLGYFSHNNVRHAGFKKELQFPS